jgi:hypothetical protein
MESTGVRSDGSNPASWQSWSANEVANWLVSKRPSICEKYRAEIEKQKIDGSKLHTLSSVAVGLDKGLIEGFVQQVLVSTLYRPASFLPDPALFNVLVLASVPTPNKVLAGDVNDDEGKRVNSGHPFIKVDEECRDVRNAWLSSRERAKFHKPNMLPAATAAELSQNLRQAFEGSGPHLLHFCGHGTKDGKIVFKDGKFEVCDDISKDNCPHLHGVFLNACHSKSHSKKLLGKVGFLIVTTTAIEDGAALCFAKEFYSALFDGTNLWSAFELGKVQLRKEGHTGESMRLEVNVRKLKELLLESGEAYRQEKQHVEQKQAVAGQQDRARLEDKVAERRREVSRLEREAREKLTQNIIRLSASENTQ